jgi:Protein of unknown function (DUF4058)
LARSSRLRQFLDKAHGWIDEAVRVEKTNLSWAERVEFRTLRREAGELLIEKPGVRQRILAFRSRKVVAGVCDPDRPLRGRIQKPRPPESVGPPKSRVPLKNWASVTPRIVIMCAWRRNLMEKSMKSPFPGMDPYIEACGLCRDFHSHLIEEIGEKLADLAPEHYLVRTGERSYVVLVDEEHRETFVEIYEATS